MKELLDYWFGDLDHTPAYFRQRNRLWFGAGRAVDAEITRLFSPLLERAEPIADSPKNALAHIVLFDQIALGVFRNARMGYELSERSIPIARLVIERGWHETLSPAERVFVFMALEHSEELADQERSVGLFTTLALGVPAELRGIFDDYLTFALRHRRVVQRFGRFPHRNETLARESTEEEKRFLLSSDAPF